MKIGAYRKGKLIPVPLSPPVRNQREDPGPADVTYQSFFTPDNTETAGTADEAAG